MYIKLCELYVTVLLNPHRDIIVAILNCTHQR